MLLNEGLVAVLESEGNFLEHFRNKHGHILNLFFRTDNVGGGILASTGLAELKYVLIGHRVRIILYKQGHKGRNLCRKRKTQKRCDCLEHGMKGSDVVSDVGLRSSRNNPVNQLQEGIEEHTGKENRGGVKKHVNKCSPFCIGTQMHGGHNSVNAGTEVASDDQRGGKTPGDEPVVRHCDYDCALSR